MILVKNNPWETLSKGKVLRVNGLFKHDIYWGKDDIERCALLFKLKNKLENTPKIILKGIIFKYDTLTDQMGFILKNNENREIFKILCDDLIFISKNEEKEKIMIKKIVKRLIAWKSLLDKYEKRELSLEEQMGLFTELKTLEEIIIPRLGLFQGIESWTGPERDNQDFLCINSAIEIKSCITSKGRVATISNSNQLVTSKEKLYLIHYTLTPFENGESILSYIQNINQLISDEEIRNKFLIKLSQFIGLSQEDENLIKFKVDDCKIYIVSDMFPRIDTTLCDKRIKNIKYSIDLEQCKEFETIELEV